MKKTKKYMQRRNGYGIGYVDAFINGTRFKFADNSIIMDYFISQVLK